MRVKSDSRNVPVLRMAVELVHRVYGQRLIVASQPGGGLQQLTDREICGNGLLSLHYGVHIPPLLYIPPQHILRNASLSTEGARASWNRSRQFIALIIWMLSRPRNICPRSCTGIMRIRNNFLLTSDKLLSLIARVNVPRDNPSTIP